MFRVPTYKIKCIFNIAYKLIRSAKKNSESHAIAKKEKKKTQKVRCRKQRKSEEKADHSESGFDIFFSLLAVIHCQRVLETAESVQMLEETFYRCSFCYFFSSLFWFVLYVIMIIIFSMISCVMKFTVNEY